MKSFFLIVLCLFFSTAAMAQQFKTSFELGDTLMPALIIIDTNYVNNKWQVGEPVKQVFDTACHGTRAIVTDTANICQANDTSVFYLKANVHTATMTFFYKLFFAYSLDIDTGSYASIDYLVLHDTDKIWVSLTDTPHQYLYPGSGTPPDFSKSTNGCVYADMLFRDVSKKFPGVGYKSPDTVLLRFRFVSGNGPAAKDGWMIDGLQGILYWSGIDEAHKDLFSIYPNPSDGTIYIKGNSQQNKDSKLVVYDMLGQEKYRQADPPMNSYLQLPLPVGTYFLKYISGDVYDVQTVVIQ